MGAEDWALLRHGCEAVRAAAAAAPTTANSPQRIVHKGACGRALAEQQ